MVHGIPTRKIDIWRQHWYLLTASRLETTKGLQINIEHWDYHWTIEKKLHWVGFQSFNFQHWHFIEFNVSESIYWKLAQCFTILLHFIWYFGSKRKIQFLFLELISLFIIKNREQNTMRLKYSLKLDDFLLFENVDNIWRKKITTLKHWNQHWIEFNVKIFNNIDIALSFNVKFLTSKTLSMSVQTLRNHHFWLRVLSLDYMNKSATAWEQYCINYR